MNISDVIASNCLILSICKKLPCEEVLPFYLEWMPSKEIYDLIGDAKNFKEESIGKMIRHDMNWKDRIPFLNQLFINGKNASLFVQIGKMVIDEGYRALNSTFVEKQVESLVLYSHGKPTNEVNSVVFKENLLISFLKKYFEVIKAHSLINYDTISSVIKCCRVTRKCKNLSLFCYRIILREYLDEIQNSQWNSPISNHLKRRAHESIAEYLYDLAKYEQLADKCRRDEVCYILEIINEIIRAERTVVTPENRPKTYDDGNGERKNIASKSGISNALARSCLELLKVNDHKIRIEVYEILKTVLE